MKKLKIYLDTSVVSQFDDSERGMITKEFFEIAKKADVELMISPMVQNEILRATPEKRQQLVTLIGLLPLTKLIVNAEADKLVERYISAGILNETHSADLTHIAYAVLAHCDYIVSWNMKHLANERTILRVHKFNSENELSKIIIVTPKQLIDNGGLYEKES
jgi:predicted nucleic acid-binding protein